MEYTPAKKLLCLWHVDRAWRGALQHIKDQQIQQRVYHNLRVLLDECNIEDTLQKTLSQLQSSPSTQRFYDYFSKTYALRKKEWAKCYHAKAGVNTNMYLEAFHHVVNYVYMKGI